MCIYDKGGDTDVATAKSSLQTAHFPHVLRYDRSSQPLPCPMPVAYPTTQAPVLYSFLISRVYKWFSMNLLAIIRLKGTKTESLILFLYPCGYMVYLPLLRYGLDHNWIPRT